MVQLVEVEDEHFQQVQPGPEEDDADFTDTGMLPYPFSTATIDVFWNLAGCAGHERF
jgi:hypothetical protein